ncbi:XcbB/CpsF family capsular polysaccharide biosynthesis protein [Paucisalibacillus globulus]|uniref:XcbB/CpsF family capsular polysaccharide biosynthesis protein n=1 Tax=Paucisalibacillus globulus TaxID=351095 RepID=UPI00040DD830|nr:accessory Sec system protein Asp2 [Paucisalibacillus globulus]
MEDTKIYNLFSENIKFNNQKRILFDTGSGLNIIQMARKDEKVYKVYKSLLENDYIHYFHEKHISKLYKREYVHELFQRKDLIKENGVFYTLDKPVGRKVNQSAPKRLLVLFTCMPDNKKFDSYLMPNRMFPKFFDGIEKNLVKNVYTMRIMDLNCSHGSHYVNTTNYQSYEKDIQNAILKVISDLAIRKENVVLYGASKGGTGSLYHSSVLDLKSLAVDPILHLGYYNSQSDFHFLKNLRKEDLTNDINENLNNCSNDQKYIICSRHVKFNYEQALKINIDKTKMIDMVDDMITAHPEVSRNSVPEQLMILNMLFSSDEYNL